MTTQKFLSRFRLRWKMVLLPTLLAVLAAWIWAGKNPVSSDPLLYDITRFVIGGGGESTSIGFYSLDSTSGQPIAGQTSNGIYSLTTGFWSIKELLVPVITWANPSDIVFGTPLSATQLNPSADVPGSFSYTPDMGAILTVGAHNLHVSFTPTDVASYATTSKDVSIQVTKATPVISFGSAPAPGYPGPDFAVSATTTNSDDFSLTFSVESGPCILVQDDTFKPLGKGICVIQANGALSNNFFGATETQSITIAPTFLRYWTPIFFFK